MTKRKERIEDEREAASAGHNASYSRDLHDHYTKLCAKISDELKNVLNDMEGKLSNNCTIIECNCYIYHIVRY